MTGLDGQRESVKSCIPAMLRARAQLQPNDVAYTVVDYEQDWDGVTESVTWSHVYRRALSVAQALRVRGSTGDRAVILAPQGLDYIVAFLGTLQAGLIAVPLSIPLDADSEERVAAVLRDASPAVILTTSAVVGSVKKYLNSQRGESPLVVYVDWPDLDWRKEASPVRERWPSTAHLQYTSGSCQPAGVIVSHSNLLANAEQMLADYCDQRGRLLPPDTTIVSWLPFDRDMGLIMGICAPILGGFHAVLMSPTAFLQRPARWMQLMARNRHVWSAAPNFGYELAARRTSDDDMAGLDLRHVLGIVDSGERIHPATLQRFTRRFAPLHLGDTVVRPTYGLAQATAYVSTRSPARRPQIVCFESEILSAGHAHRCANAGGTALVSYGVPRSPVVRIVHPDTRTECAAGSIGEIWVYGGDVALGYWQRPQETEHTFGARLVAGSRGTPAGPWLRTRDLGFFSDGELFIVGRIKERAIAHGRQRFRDDIDARLSAITRGPPVVASEPDHRHSEAAHRHRIGPGPTTMPCAG